MQTFVFQIRKLAQSVDINYVIPLLSETHNLEHNGFGRYRVLNSKLTDITSPECNWILIWIARGSAFLY